MAVNRGKSFEGIVEKCFLTVPKVSIDRVHDQTNGYMGSSNICDFIVYRKPFQYYIECKSVHGNTLSIHSIDHKHNREVYGNITHKQWTGLLAKSVIDGVLAGVLCWWVDKDVTRFIPIQCLQEYRDRGAKSVRYDADFPTIKDSVSGALYEPFIVEGQKKRVFFDYDMSQFFTVGEHILRGDRYDL